MGYVAKAVVPKNVSVNAANAVNFMVNEVEANVVEYYKSEVIRVTIRGDFDLLF
jgi:hypothetical protein